MGYKFNPFTGTLDEVDAGGGGGTPGGSDTQVQFNDGGSFGGDDGLTFNKTTNELTVGASTGDGGSAKVYGDINLDDGGASTTTIQCVTPTANRTISFPNATGTVALVAGSSGQPIYNNAGAYAGLSTATIGATGNITLSLNGASGVAPVAVTGTWFAGTTPQVLIQPSTATAGAWSPSGTGIGVNAASGFGGNLLDLQFNGTSKLKVSQFGDITGTAASIASLGTLADLNNGYRIIHATGIIRVAGSTGRYSFSPGDDSRVAADTGLKRDQAGVVALTDGSTGVGYLKTTPVAVSALPAAATVGAGTRGFVSDSTVAASGNFGATVVGGGSNYVPVFSDGTNWLIG